MAQNIEEKFGIQTKERILPNTKENIMQELKIGEQIYNGLERLTVEEANEKLTYDGKRKWVRIYTATANTYFIDNNGVIKPVDPAGWYY